MKRSLTGASDAPAKRKRPSRFSQAPVAASPSYSLATQPAANAAALAAVAQAREAATSRAVPNAAKRAAFQPAPLILDGQGRQVDASGRIIAGASNAGSFATLAVNKSNLGAIAKKHTDRANPYLAHMAGGGSGEATGRGDGSTMDSVPQETNPDVAPANESSGTATGFDDRLRFTQRSTRARKAFKFVKAGTYIKHGDSLRSRAAGKLMAGYLSGRNPATRGSAGRGIAPGLYLDTGITGTSAEAGGGDAGAGNVRINVRLPPRPGADRPIPDVEWWDEAFLPPTQRAARAAAWAAKTAADASGLRKSSDAATDKPADLPSAAEPLQELRVEHARAHALVEHPVPIAPVTAEQQGEVTQDVMLTKQERKRIRRQNRLEREREKQDKIALGLMPAPEPKVKISNMMRVLGEQAVADPSKVEQQVMEAVQKRQLAHDMRNLARKLTPEERRAKKLEKMKAEGSGADDTHVAVFWVADLSCGQKRFKVDVNAQQNHLTGGVVIVADERLNLVVVEGGAKGVKRFVKLMVRRIDWSKDAGAGSDDEDDSMAPDDGTSSHRSSTDAGVGPAAAGALKNECKLAWQGVVTKRSFNNFRYQECRSSETARKVLAAKGCEHYWDSICSVATQQYA